MKKILFIFSLVIIMTLNIGNKIPDESIRFRVIPNSNSIEDTYIKTIVLEELSDSLLKFNPTTINESRIIIEDNLYELEEMIKESFKKYNYDKKFTINYGSNYFPKKVYKGQSYDEGYYESLVITIGEGKGDNFWCVLFPPLCLLEAEEDEDIEYDFYLVKLWKQLFSNK